VARACERSPKATASSERPKVSLTAGGEAAGESFALAYNRRVAPVTAWRYAPRAAGGVTAADETGEA